MSWTELRKQLAQRAGVSEKEANAFWSAFNSQLVEALKQDKQVKINGLGTFKLQAVAPRKSVNVTTGEAMTIEGYNKIAFVPEASVKELVEKEASPKPAKGKAKATDSEIDPLKKLGEQATEIVDILGELGQAPEKEKKAKGRKAKVVEPEQVKEPEPVKVAEPAPVVEEPKVVEKPKVVVEPKPVEPVVEPEPEKPEPAKPEPEKPEPEKPKKQYHFVRDTLICVVCLLLLLLVGYFFLRKELSNWIESLVQPQPAQSEVVADTTAISEGTEQPTPTSLFGQPQAVLHPEGKEEPIKEEPVKTEPAKAEPAKVEPVKQEPAKVEPVKNEPAKAETKAQGYEILTIEEMHQDSRMTWMAKRYYGDKKYWPYIYDANKDRIPNPGRIQVGEPVRIPKLTKAQLDTTRAETRKKLEQLTLEAEAACWAN